MARAKTPKTAAPVTTAQKLGALLKSARDTMRKDKGLNGDLDRLPLLTWLMFLKFLDDREAAAETEAALARKKYAPTIDPPYRWRDWAANDALTGDDLLKFVSAEKVTLPRLAPGDTPKEGPGLIPYLRAFAGSADPKRQVVGEVFAGVSNRMESGYLLRSILEQVSGIHFDAADEIHTLGHLYESMLKEMRDAAGDSGEFYTPRAVVRFMVAATDPRLGETVLDPACGTGGFLVEAFAHLKAQATQAEHHRLLQERSVFGQEAKPLPYMLCLMNLLLHGMDTPKVDKGNSLAVKLSEIGDSERADVILTNPPFGGEEQEGVQGGFPADKRTSETALLFLQLIMRKLRKTPKAGRAAVVVPNGMLFGTGVCAAVKQELLTNFNLHTVVRLPNGVFAPYTSIPTNVLFFDRTGPTGDIWYYELPPPDGRKQYTKTAPMPFEAFAECLAWWPQREEGERAWKVPFAAELAAARAKAEVYWQAAEAAEARAAQRKGDAAAADAEPGRRTVRGGVQPGPQEPAGEGRRRAPAARATGGRYSGQGGADRGAGGRNPGAARGGREMSAVPIRLGELCTLTRGSSATLRTNPGPYPLVVTAAFRRTSDQYQFEGPSVCVPLISSTGHGDAALHRVHYQEGKFALANLLVALQVRDESQCYPKYLYHLLNAKKDELLVPLMLGTANVSLKERDIASVQISLPPLAEQQRIVARVDAIASRVAEARRLREEAVEGTRRLCRAILRDDSHGVPTPTPMCELVQQREQDVTVERDKDYHFAGVYCFGRGVFRGQKKKGLEFSYDRLTTLRTGDFVYPKLMAWEGALAVVPQECHGLVVSTEFPVFEIDTDRVLPEVLDVYFRDPEIWPQLSSQSTGTNVRRQRLNPSDFLKYQLPLPPRRVQEQLRQVVKTLDAIRPLQVETAAELDALLPSVLARAFAGGL